MLQYYEKVLFMSESNKSLDELIEKSNYFWLKEETTDASYKFNKSEFKEFLSKSFDLIRNKKLTISKLLGKIEYYADERFNNDDFKDQLDEVYWILYHFLVNTIVKKDEIDELYSHIKNLTHDSIWSIAKFAFKIIAHFGEYLEDSKKASSLCGLLFSNWSDLEKWLQRGNNTAEENIAYHELLVERRELVLQAIFVLDKKYLKEPMERAIDETYIGWGTNWDELLALKYLYLLNKKDGVKSYLELIIDGLISCDYDDDYEAVKDCGVALGHLTNIDEKLAIDTLLEIIIEGELSSIDDWEYFQKPVKYIVCEKSEMKEYFKKKVKQLNNSTIEEIYFPIIGLD